MGRGINVGHDGSYLDVPFDTVFETDKRSRRKAIAI
jgi:hypothetical protein